jgi:rhamnose transport system permease protein
MRGSARRNAQRTTRDGDGSGASHLSRWALRLAPCARRRRPAGRQTALVGLLVVAVLALAPLSPEFLVPANLLEMSRNAMEVGLLALGMTFVILTGGIDLSVGSIMGLAAVTLGFCWQHGGLPIGAAAAAAIGVGLAGGLLNGLLMAALRERGAASAARGRAAPPALIVTLATLAVYRGLAYGISRSQDVHGFPESFAMLGQGSIAGWLPAPTLLWLVLAVALALFLDRTAGGRVIRAMGANEEAARLSGVAVDRVRLFVYGLSGLLAGLAAVVYVSRVSTAKADAGLGYELAAITVVVLGGTRLTGGEGGLLGTTLGLALTQVVQYGLTLAGMKSDRQVVVLGLLLIGAVWLDRRRGAA